MSIYQRINKRIPIHKGWSGDLKYCALNDEEEKYLLHVSSLDRLERKRREYEKMCEL